MDYNPTKGGSAVQPKVDLFETERRGEMRKLFLPPTLLLKDEGVGHWHNDL